MKNLIRTIAAAAVLMTAASNAAAQASFVSIADPDGVTTVYVGATDGVAWYSIDHGESLSMPASRLGLKTNAYDWTSLKLDSFQDDEIVVDYTMAKTKAST